MKISPHKHQQIRLKNGLITLVILTILILLAWLSQNYTSQIDLTANDNNTLSKASQQILLKLSDPIYLTAYIKKKPLQKQIILLVDQYRRFKKDITLEFIDPSTVPEKARELKLGAQGAILVNYQQRTEKIIFLDESTLSNALLQLANTQNHWVSFLTGHGERSVTGQANFDWGIFGEQLSGHQINVANLNLSKVNSIPSNTSLLVIASPATRLLPAELNIINDYINLGGNLLLVTDPNNLYLADIEQSLGITKLTGTIIDSNTGLYGVEDPTFVIINEYTTHPVTQNFNNISLFPISAALDNDEESHFLAHAILSTASGSWTEVGVLSEKIQFNIDTEEREGPLTLAYALTREHSNKAQQRIIVIGDGDFLSNTYLGNVGNAELGFRIINWLTHDDQFIQIPSKSSLGTTLQFSKTTIAIIGVWFLLVFPLLLMLTGFIIWRRRKRR